MKAKVERGSGFRGVLNYAVDPEKDAQLVGGNMTGTTPRELASEFAISRKLRPECAKPVMHFSLALPKGEDLAPHKWAEVADAFMAEMGLDRHQFVAVKHEDQPHKHIHIIASRIGLDGMIWQGQWEVFRAIEATQVLEKRFGLTITPGLDSVDAEDHKKNITKNEMEQAMRTGEAPARQLLQNIIDDAVQGNPSVTAFVERLEAAGVTVKPNVASTGKLNGFGFSINGIPFKGSDLGKKYTWKGLQQQGVTYDQIRESSGLISRKGETIDSEGANRVPDTGANPGLVDQSVDSERREPVNGQGVVAPDQSDRENGQGLDHGIDKQGLTERVSIEQSGIENGDRREPNQADSADRSQSDWLHSWSRLASDVADLAATADPGVVDGIAEPVTKALQAKQEAWNRQSAALGSPLYRITLKGRLEGLPTYNIGKRKDQSEKFYSQTEVTDLLPKLSRENARGFDVYLTPIDEKHHYLVIDDMRDEAMKQLRADGFQPCLVQQSSHDNWQAIIKLPKASLNEQKEANELVGELNKRYGDPRFSGVVHPFRMAGFSNKKPGRNNAFTVVREAVHRLCDKASNMLASIKERVEKASQRSAERFDRERQILVAQDAKGAPRDTIDAFRRAYAKHTGLAHSQGWVIDDSRLDWSATIDLLKSGHSRESVAKALLDASPSILDRHNDPHDYATRTVDNALKEDEVVKARARNAMATLLEKTEEKQTVKRSGYDQEFKL